MASTYRVLEVPTTPLSAMESVINVQAADGYEYMDHFFGSDGSHHVAGGTGPTTTTATVVDPKSGTPIRATITTNRVVMIFRHA
jgi:hypothetical protein